VAQKKILDSDLSGSSGIFNPSDLQNLIISIHTNFFNLPFLWVFSYSGIPNGSVLYCIASQSHNIFYTFTEILFHLFTATMALIEEFAKSGNWLFKRRGFLPVFILALGLLYFALKDYAIYQPNPYRDVVYLRISFLGFAVRIFTIGQTPRGTSGRNIKRQRAETLNTTGIYSLVRHPLYLGNFIIWLGVALFLESFWCVIVFLLFFWLYYERIMFAEEYFLRDKFGKQYLDWASYTPAFFPKFRNWKSSNLVFSWRNVMKREYHGFVNIFLTFTFLDLARSFFMSGRPYPSKMWIYLVSGAVFVWIIFHALNKTTKLFRVKGR